MAVNRQDRVGVAIRTGEAIRIAGLHFRWPRQAAACLDIDEFDVEPGERVFLHGPSGSGKSTLLGLLGGIAVPQRGTVEVLGASLNTLSPRARDRLRADRIGFIFQQFNLLPWLSALDNVLLPCTFSSRRKGRAGQPRKEAERLFDHLDLAADLWHKPAAELSVGQQQRVAAARALICRPEIIIADEPTAALDAPRQQRFVDLLLQEAAAGAALL
ncbi:MAG: ATP-binding cassette domain-containing protein, partial [Betaproteobacteria bacterium]|nr:ATP-binding cassette domain-containing protein [Betaproteobacteria bacterium]